MKTIGKIYRENLIDKLQKNIDDNGSLFLLSYSNIKSPKLSEFRKELKKAGGKVLVSKNSLARVAFKNLKQEKLAERITGQTALVWGPEDSVEIAKIVVKFAKEIQALKIQGGLLQDKILEANDIKTLSDLPSREVLLAKLLGTIQAPISRLLGSMNAKSRELLSILKQLSEKKQTGGSAGS